MRALASLPTPDALARLATYEQRREDAAGGGPPLTASELTGYRHKDVKEALLAETHRKCAYCESVVTHVYWGDVEHILPKDVACRPELIFDYSNLTIACSKCNNAKRFYCEPDLPMVNPYQDDPEDHFCWLGPMTWQKSPRGEVTRHRLKLDRKGLVERRQERIEEVGQLAQRYIEEPPGSRKDALFEQLFAEIDPEREYTAHVRAALQHIGIPV